MSWQLGIAYFFGGVFLANATPHFVAGISGKPFHSPFASPPFRGLSPPAVNIAWALFNLAVGYVLLLHVGEFDIRSWSHAATSFAGFGAMAFQVVRSLGRMRAEREGGPGS